MYDASFSIIWLLFSLLLYIGLPIALIILVSRSSRRHNTVPVGSAPVPQQRNDFTTRQLILTALVVPAGLLGIISIYTLPQELLRLDSSSAAFFGAQVVFGGVLLALGAFLRRVTGTLLLVLGTIAVFVASPFIFQNLGSAGVLVIIALVLAALIALMVRLEKKGQS